MQASIDDIGGKSIDNNKRQNVLPVERSVISDNEKIKYDLLEKITEVRSLTKNVTKYIQKIDSKMNSIEAKLKNISRTTTGKENDINAVRKKLPLRSEETFKEVETMIMEYPHIYGELMTYLSTLPDTSFSRHCDIIFNTLLSPNFAINFTVSGTKKKYEFLATRIGSLFVECLTTKYPEISRGNVIKHIGTLFSRVTRKKAYQKKKGAIVSGRRDMSLITPSPIDKI